jgi:hypothetical protein
MTITYTLTTPAETGRTVPVRTAPDPVAGFRILLVTPRTVAKRPTTGRDKLLWDLVAQNSEFGAVETVTIPNVFAGRRTVSKLISAAGRLLWDVLRGRPASLQSMLFRSREGDEALAEAIRRFKPDILYMDSIRLAHLVPRGPDRPCVVLDLDDLLSRRIQSYVRGGLKPGVGELGRSIPRFIVSLLERPLISKLYFAVEKAVTRWTELRATREADALILTSPAEVRAFSRFARRYGGSTPLVMTHPLAVNLGAPIPRGRPRRLTFVGTARLPQNEDGILWCRRAAAGSSAMPVEIYGSGEQPPAPGEPRFIGYVDDLSCVYASDAVPTCMTRIRGGIKTKILEAWSYGAPIMVTPQGLEGVDLKDYPLKAAWNAPTAEVLAMMTPQALETAVAMGRDYLARVYGADSAQARWREVFTRAMASFQGRQGAG